MNVELELTRGYACIEQARLERLRFFQDEEEEKPVVLLLHNHNHNSKHHNNRTTLTLQTGQRHTGVEEEEEDDVYEDDEDWEILPNAAMQEFNQRQLEHRFIHQQQQHHLEIEKLNAVVRQLQEQAALSTRRWQEQQEEVEQVAAVVVAEEEHHTRFAHTSNQDPPLLSHRYQHNQHHHQRRHPAVPAPPLSPSTTTTVHYEKKIQLLEEHLREMSNTASSHELQVVTDSSAILTDMSLKLGEHIGENKFLKRRLLELTQEVKDAHATYAQPSTPEQSENENNNALRPPFAAVNQDGSSPATTTMPKRAVLPLQTPEKTEIPITTTSTTPTTIAAPRGRGKQAMDPLLMVRNVPIDGRIKLASKLRKLERMALQLLQKSQYSRR